MGFWTKLLGLEAKSDDPTERVARQRGIVSSAGTRVTAETALQVSTVLACVRVLANGVAQVPFRVYQEDGNGGRVPATEHPLYRVIYRRPNQWQTSHQFRETVMFHVLLTGNAYVFVNRVGSQRRIVELVPIEPNLVQVDQRPDGSIEYRVTSKNGAQQKFPTDAIWHLRGPSWNGWLGLDAVKLARDAIGLSISLEQGQSDFQKNGAQTSGLLSIKEKVSPEKFEFLSKWLDKHSVGGERSNKPLILDQGADYKSFTMSGVDQQLLETRKHQIEEICREFGVMPIMVGHADKTATYASAEQMFLAHVVHSLSPWYHRIEQSADTELLSETDQEEGYYTKFTPNALMRGAANDRANFYKAALGAGGSKGWMTQNEVRSFEELNRSDEPEADMLPQQSGSPQDVPNTDEEDDANADAA